jgi:hypothetical protein
MVPRGTRSAPTDNAHIEDHMMNFITRATLGATFTAALLFAAACSDDSSSPTGPVTSSTRDTTTTTTGTPTYSRAGTPRVAFGFNGTASGFPLGAVFLTGGGSFDPATASNVAGDTTTDVHSNGGFRCVDAVGQGPLTTCARDEGVRWDTAQLLASTRFKCTATDALKTAATGPGKAVLLADFYRAGDGIDESFTAQMVVSDTDLAPNIPGEQTLWIQGVGCGSANVHFN